MIVYIYNIGVDLYNGFNGLRHRINWTYFTVLDGLAHPLYSIYLKVTNQRSKKCSLICAYIKGAQYKKDEIHSSNQDTLSMKPTSKAFSNSNIL